MNYTRFRNYRELHRSKNNYLIIRLIQYISISIPSPLLYNISLLSARINEYQYLLTQVRISSQIIILRSMKFPIVPESSIIYSPQPSIYTLYSTQPTISIVYSSSLSLSIIISSYSYISLASYFILQIYYSQKLLDNFLSIISIYFTF